MSYYIYIVYSIRPNYCSVRLGFSKLLGRLLVKYVSAYLGYTLKKKRSAKDLFDEVYAIFFSDFLYNSYVVGTHSNFSSKSMQFKWVHSTYDFLRK